VTRTPPAKDKAKAERTAAACDGRRFVTARASRRTGAWLVVAMATIGAGRVEAQERRVDDPEVLAPRRVRVTVGAGVVWAAAPLSPPNETVYSEGAGGEVEEAVGLGHGLELGARFGARSSDLGRSLRADTVARGTDTETFGTGVAAIANPELRVRFQAIAWAWGEAGVEERAVLPIRETPDFTNVVGPWASFRFAGVARADVGVEAIVSRQSIATGALVQPAFGLPVRVWGNVTRSFSAGVFASLHAFGGTSVTPALTTWIVGGGAGYRIGGFDLTLTVQSLDAGTDLTREPALGLSLSWQS
jgi:hypothetical protein